MYAGAAWITATRGKMVQKSDLDHALSMSFFSHFWLKRRMDSA
jgi:hypothetical protein